MSQGAARPDPDLAPAVHERVRSALRAIGIFSELPEEVRETIVADSELVTLRGGDWLFRQDDPGDALYVVSSGRVEVVLERPAPATVLRVLGRGAALGELAVITDSPRSASARTIRDSELVRVRRDQVLRLLNDSAPFAISLTRTLGRLVQASGPPPQPSRPRSGVIAVVPAHAGVPVRSFADQLQRAISRWGRVSLLERAARQPGGSDGDDGFAAYGRALDRDEREHDYVILVGADDEDPAWNTFCRRQADRVVLVAVPESASPPTERSSAWVGSDLVLWGPADQTARHVAAFLDALAPLRHHHVESGSRCARDVERVARRLLGRSVGIVLSGGGACGLAHIGVLETLVEGGVQIDRVGGCSFGAFVGGMFAMGRSPGEILAICREQLVRRNPFNDYVIPRHSLVRGRKSHAMLKKVYGDVTIEQLPLDLYCVSSDLLTAEVVVHRRGSLTEAVRASASVPGLGPPISRDGRLLVDGGVLNNFPIDIMMGADEGPVVAVDAMGRRLHRPRTVPGPDDPDGGDLAAMPDVPPPTIYEVLTRTATLGSWHAAERTRAEVALVIACDLEGFGMFDFKRLDEIVEAGRSAARAVLAESQKLSG